MTKEMKPFDISDTPDLMAIADIIRKTNEPRLLRRGDEDVAILMPLRPIRRRGSRKRTEADYRAFLSAAGSWKDVDTDALIAGIRESRRRSSRAPFEL